MNIYTRCDSKVTVNAVIIIVISLLACGSVDDTEDQLTFQEQVDLIASKRIDSAYKRIAASCDSLASQRVATIVDSLLLNDTLNSSKK